MRTNLWMSKTQRTPAPLTNLGGRSVLFVMAADAEYGPHLRERFTPVMIGVGPVEAAVELTAALAELSARGQRPDLVVSLGSAGSRDLEQTEVYQATSVAYRDMDASPLGFEKGVTPFLDLPATLPLPLRIPGIPEAKLSTGADIVSGAAYEAIAADMVDMKATPACVPAPASTCRWWCCAASPTARRSSITSTTGRPISTSSTRSWPPPWIG